jgi:hypothetical protein
MNADDPLCSRSAQTCPWGKCEKPVEVGLPAQIFEDVVMLAGLERKSKGEWIRDLVIRELRGSVEFARMRYESGLGKSENAG